ncbi:hypothetical protein GCM10023214_00600 [Amycolatopsis dongchuanensis]|uniref:Uncharacterized protein n=1 Tax=Amycolatopsis dongchuanensis TaxID=1070866 RepID=A0ABP9PR65_9PSEU
MTATAAVASRVALRAGLGSMADSFAWRGRKPVTEHYRIGKSAADSYFRRKIAAQAGVKER